MPGKTTLVTEASEIAGDLMRRWEAALADGRLDLDEAIDLAGDTAMLSLAVQRVAVAQQAGVSLVRYGTLPRDAATDVADLARRVADTIGAGGEMAPARRTA